MKIINLFWILILCGTVNALQDVNISIDAPMQLCFCIANLTNCVCEKNQTLSIDGRADNVFYLRPYTAYQADMVNYYKNETARLRFNFTQMLQFGDYTIRSFGDLFIALIFGVLGIVILLVFAIIAFVSFIKRHDK